MSLYSVLILVSLVHAVVQHYGTGTAAAVPYCIVPVPVPVYGTPVPVFNDAVPVTIYGIVPLRCTLSIVPVLEYEYRYSGCSSLLDLVRAGTISSTTAVARPTIDSSSDYIGTGST